MDDEIIWLWCESEKTGERIGVGIYLADEETIEDFVVTKEILRDLEESFWALHGEFEFSVRNAIEAGEITTRDFDSFFWVFGHFHYVVEMNGKKITLGENKIEAGIDADQYMYDLLVEYVSVD